MPAAAVDVWQTAVAGLAAVVLLLLFVVRSLARRAARLARQGRSMATRHGQTVEQFAPFLRGWAWDPKRFRFLGSPVDGIQFTDDEVLIVEVKTGSSRLSAEQRRIRDLVEAGRVRWVEVRI